MQDVRPLLQLRIVKTDVACCLNVVHILGGFKSTITGCFLSDQQILWPIKPKIWRLNFIRFIWIVQNRRAISNFRTICVNHIWVGLVTKYVDLTKINQFISDPYYIWTSWHVKFGKLRPLEKGPVLSTWHPLIIHFFLFFLWRPCIKD